jgi:hypothetical protein
MDCEGGKLNVRQDHVRIKALVMVPGDDWGDVHRAAKFIRLLGGKWSTP